MRMCLVVIFKSIVCLGLANDINTTSFKRKETFYPKDKLSNLVYGLIINLSQEIAK